MRNTTLNKVSTEILNQRYQIIDLLGEGGCGKTYRAFDQQTQHEVAIKILHIDGMPDWKTLELFEREVKILSQLNHRAIPRYLDFFRATIAGNEALCLVQELAPGRTLSSWIASGHIFGEIELQQIAEQILEILIYLQDFTPPIIHRDIKPQNILLTGTREVYLVDFGAVRDTYNLTIAGSSTIVGTYGYMAPEQTRGQAVLATDLYGLGTTLLYLGSGADPADLPVKQMKIDFRSRLKFSPQFTAWLEKLLEPFPEDRYINASTALDCLHHNEKIADYRPNNALAQIFQEGETLTIIIPQILLSTKSSKRTFFVTIAFLLVLLALFVVKLETLSPDTSAFMFALSLWNYMVFLIWPFYSIFTYYFSVMFRHEIIIDSHSLTHVAEKSGKRFVRKAIVLDTIKSISSSPAGLLFMSHCVDIKGEISGEHLSHCFGRYLNFPEQRWIAARINQFRCH